MRDTAPLDAVGHNRGRQVVEEGVRQRRVGVQVGRIPEARIELIQVVGRQGRIGGQDLGEALPAEKRMNDRVLEPVDGDCWGGADFEKIETLRRELLQ
jgi:hypothetical protein